MERGCLTRVTKDFFTTIDGELSLVKGDYFLIHDVIDKHWFCGESRERLGKFPSSHVSRVNLPEVRDTGNAIFVTVAAFRGEQDGDLSFGEGELVIGARQVEENWFFGYGDGREGIFPLSHVWRLDPSVLKMPARKKSVRRRARVKTSLRAQLEDELDLREGEIVTIHEVIEDGWVRGETEFGRVGNFPEAFVRYIEDEPEVPKDPEVPSSSRRKAVDTMEKSYEAADEPAPNYYDLFPEVAETAPEEAAASAGPETTTNENTTPGMKTPPYGNLNPLGVEPYAITLYPFKAQYPNELSFGEGEVVRLLGHLDAEWAEGTIDEARGYFPISYVNVIVDCRDSRTHGRVDAGDTPEATVKSSLAHPEVGATLKVEYTFEAQMRGDLTVTEGDLVTVLEIANDDWLCVRNARGDVGLCPRQYLAPEILPNSEHDSSLEDFVVVMREKRHGTEDETGEIRDTSPSRRLSEPHRPAPPVPAPGRTPLRDANSQEPNCPEMARKNDDEVSLGGGTVERRKRADKRQNVISELVITEKEYVRDLTLTYETFELHNPCGLESRGIDVAVIFGNLLEVIHTAEELLDHVLRSMKGRDEEDQTIAPCFLNMTERLQTVYGKYCANHEAALCTLKKYEDNREIMNIFERGIETLRRQVVCFDMSSILIKPVQRILKYPLMLYELIKCTEDNHPDREGIEEAWKAMTQVASHINEYKRRKDLVSKYLDDDNNTLMRKMSKLTIHSVAKKSSRLSAKLSATLGLTNLTVDPEFEELERCFKVLEKCVWQLSKDVEQCMTFLEDEATCGEILGDLLARYYTGTPDVTIERYVSTRQTIKSRYFEDLKRCVERRVYEPINCLASLLEGPAVLITKRYDKLLDYDNAISRRDKSRDSKIAQDELNVARTNFEALNQQLLEELPILVDAGTAILANSIAAFANARKLLSGRSVRCYLSLSTSATQVSSQNVLESFLVNHHLVWNQISRCSFGAAAVSPESTRTPTPTPTPTPATTLLDASCPAQTERQRANLRGRYPPDALHVATTDVASSSSLDLSATRGTLVAVIKRQDPMGDSRRWFVDNGAVQGFLASGALQPFANNRDIDENEEARDLMCLESPKKIVNSAQVFATARRDEANSMAGDENEDFVRGPQRYENVRPEFFYASYDFRQARPETLAITKGQALKLVRRHDEEGNEDWWLVEDRYGNIGYVPRNYLLTRD